MSSDLRKLVATAAAKPHRGVDVDAVLSRGRQLGRRRAGALLAGSAVMGILAWFVAWQVFAAGNTPGGDDVASSAPDGSARYVVGKAEIVDSASGGEARVSFSLAWSGDRFPGIRDCAVTLRDQSGAVVGERALHRVYMMRPGPATLTKKISASGRPSSADVACGERLDDPDGRYVASDVAVTQVPGSSEILVEFDSAWNGEGVVPGIASCQVVVLADGSVITDEEITFSTEASVAEGTQIPLVADPSGPTPTDATVDCSPYVG